MKHIFHNRKITIFIFILILSIPVTGIPAAAQNDETTDVTLFLSFIPSVQFAPVYVAIEKGFFADEGINLTPEHSFNEADGIDRIAVDNLQFGIISGEQVIVARGAEKPLVYVYEWYHKFPVGVVAPADSDIHEPADLAGKKVGIPGPFGASYMGFRALIASADLTEDDLQLETIGFTAPESMCQGNVDAAVVYISNEPLTIQENCFDVTVMPVSDYADLVSNGLVTNDKTIENNPELVAGMVNALQRGILYTIENPDEAFDISVQKYVLDLPEEEYDTQRQVLANSIELWTSDDPGATNPQRWENTQEIMLEIGFIEEPLEDLQAAYSNDFLPQNQE